MINKLWIFLLFPVCCLSQTLTGTVVDDSTKQPLETVSVYFDNTTVGTTTNEKGEFAINYTDAIQSSLVISYLGYEKVIINDYRSQTVLNIALKPSSVALDEVYINYDDGLTRRQKLRLFRKEFLGTSIFAKTCKILNEDDLVLRYDKKNRVLYVNANAPIIIRNRALQYEIAFDIIDFEASYRYANIETQNFALDKVAYTGTTYYKDLEKANKKSTKRKREEAYKGSVQHFMRALYNKKLKEEGYEIYFNSFKVDEYDYFNIEPKEDSDFKEVTLRRKVSILYDKQYQSDIDVFVDSFLVDVYGNYSAIKGIYFTGAMGSQRIGDTLPLDYGL
ncbi:carboxypeptidase-like regulatory domain-containing protein [Winogradskyella sp.]|uniref:carboxypeptidase-like regulatory domain-containing protein n=1 Tax=Winogradskyella sp. TaxID=1883156 RepID=UPI002605DD80|nr:carboxypeptidase-like regulatory domain-containing protein [Winogradskyella sp.]